LGPTASPECIQHLSAHLLCASSLSVPAAHSAPRPVPARPRAGVRSLLHAEEAPGGWVDGLCELRCVSAAGSPPDGALRPSVQP
jgi:hypothetical protein